MSMQYVVKRLWQVCILYVLYYPLYVFFTLHKFFFKSNTCSLPAKKACGSQVAASKSVLGVTSTSKEIDGSGHFFGSSPSHNCDNYSSVGVSSGNSPTQHMGLYNKGKLAFVGLLPTILENGESRSGSIGSEWSDRPLTSPTQHIGQDERPLALPTDVQVPTYSEWSSLACAHGGWDYNNLSLNRVDTSSNSLVKLGFKVVASEPHTNSNYSKPVAISGFDGGSDDYFFGDSMPAAREFKGSEQDGASPATTVPSEGSMSRQSSKGNLDDDSPRGGSDNAPGAVSFFSSDAKSVFGSGEEPGEAFKNIEGRITKSFNFKQ